MKPSKIKVIISDCHLSAGPRFESERNPHEDFHYDDEMVSFFEHFSTGDYDDGCEVELILNGDFFDFLNVPYRGEFEDVITEQFALYKLECVMAGHPRVMMALKKFAAKEGKTILYNIGNHDADMFFPKLREQLIRTLDPHGRFPSEKVRINFEQPEINLEGGVQLHHGNQFEASHWFNYERPVMSEGLPLPVLNIPWGSFYVLKIVNRFKWEREYVDKVRPVKAMLLWGLVFDTWFTLKFFFLSVFYFLKTRFIYNPHGQSRFAITLAMLKQELTTFLQDLESDARELLDAQPEVHTIIMGHTHRALEKIYPDGKLYINTGTWTHMINLDLRGIGEGDKLTFALLEYGQTDTNRPRCTLNFWLGDYKPHKPYSR